MTVETIPSAALTGTGAGVKQTYSDTLNNELAIVRDRVVKVQPPESSMLRYMEIIQERGGGVWDVMKEGDPLIWWDDGMVPQEVRVTTQFTDTDTGTLVLADTSFLKKGDMLQYGRETIRCTADPSSSTQVAVKRNWPPQPLSVGNIEVGEVLRIYTEAQFQGAAKGRMFYQKQERRENNYQIFERGTGITGSQAANDTYVHSAQMAYQMGRNLRELRRRLNEALMFNPGAVLASASEPGFMKGFEGYIEDHQFTVNGRLNYDVVEQAVLSCREHNDDETGTYALFCSEQAAAEVARTGKDFLQTPIDLKEFGFYCNVLAGNGWRVEIIPSYSFRGPNAGKALLAASQHIGFRPKRGRDWAEELQVQTPGTDTEEGLWRGEFTGMFRNQLAHAVIRGIQN